MRKKTFPFILLLVALSIVSGYLLSKATLIGRTGINLFYKEYKFLKTWWKGGALVFVVLLLLFLVQGWAQKKLSARTAKLLHVTALLLAVIGLYLTYNDFRHSFNHRLLGERFHIGSYLFWFGWMMVSLFYLFQKKDALLPAPAPVLD